MDGRAQWVEFWNRPNNAIYVNKRNLEVHFACLRDDLLPYVPAGGTVIDVGCGDALAAGAISERCGRLFLYDAAPAVRARIAERYAGWERIHILDDSGMAAMEPGTADLIVVVSVLQYVAPADLPALLGRWHDLLAPGGRLLIADVVQPDTPLHRDVGSQLALAARHGFLAPAILGIARLALSDYRQIRQRAGFATYTEDQLLRLFAASGLSAERLPRNIGPTPHRLSFIARRATPTS